MPSSNYPKFDNKIQTQIDQSRMRQAKTRPGIIMSFDMKMNTASVILEDQYSGQIGNILHGVPCPVVVGIQSAAPEPGTPCIVQFRDDNESDPYIISYFDKASVGTSYARNYTANSGIPKFMAR
jgi:hypothetical protein